MGGRSVGRLGAKIRKRRARLAALLLAQLAVLGMLGAQDPEPALFTADVRLVTLPATVKDRHGAPIGGLGPEDFQILEEGQPRELAVFERRTNRPLSVALMLDASQSTAIELRFERGSASRFFGRLLEPAVHIEDRAAVFSFSGSVEELQGFTRKQKDLKDALNRVKPQNGTSVYDAIVVASGELGGRVGRRVIVIITDGGDTTSFSTYDEALRAAHEAEAAIYPLIVLPIRADAGRNRGGEHALLTLARSTGGEAFVQHGTSDLDAAFDAVLLNLRTQYLLGFYPVSDAGVELDGFQRTEVRVAREGATVLVRSGYFEQPSLNPGRPAPPEVVPVRLRQPAPRRPALRTEGDEERDELVPLPPRRTEDDSARPRIVKPR